MSEYSPVYTLVWEWAGYLEQRGHQVKQPANAFGVLLSRNSRRRGYRWVFLHAEGPTRRLTAIEHENIKRQTVAARKARQKAYLIVKFERPVGKVVIMPAEKAAQVGRLRSDKGGIPWDW